MTSQAVMIGFGSLLCAALGLIGAALWRLGNRDGKQAAEVAGAAKLDDLALTEIRAVRGEVQSLRGELRAELTDMRSALRTQQADISKGFQAIDGRLDAAEKGQITHGEQIRALRDELKGLRRAQDEQRALTHKMSDTIGEHAARIASTETVLRNEGHENTLRTEFEEMRGSRDTGGVPRKAGAR